MEERYPLRQVSVRLCLAEAEPLYDTRPIDSPERAVEVMAKMMAELDREHLCVVSLDGQNRPICMNVASIGTVNASLARPADLMKSAILSNAASFFLIHNHPSGRLEDGDPVRPSREDRTVTRRMAAVGELLGIPLLDHVIVSAGTGDTYSFRERDPSLFQASLRQAFSDVILEKPRPYRGKKKEKDLGRNFHHGRR